MRITNYEKRIEQNRRRTEIVSKSTRRSYNVRNIKKFYDEPILRKELGAAARTHALSTFAVREHAERVQAVYDTFLLAD